MERKATEERGRGTGRSCHLRIVHKDHLRAEEMAQLSECMLGKDEDPR